MKTKNDLPVGWMSVPLVLLDKAPWNYREDDAFMLEKLTANIRLHGQVENIIVREMDEGRYEVINGNHRLDAFKSVGLTHAMVYNMGKISLRDAQRVAIETNEHRFESDRGKLKAILEELTAAFDAEDLDTTIPFTQDEMDALASAPIDFAAPGMELETQAPLPTEAAKGISISYILRSVGVETFSSEDAQFLTRRLTDLKIASKASGAYSYKVIPYICEVYLAKNGGRRGKKRKR